MPKPKKIKVFAEAPFKKDYRTGEMQRDSAFIKEAENVRKLYKNDPNTKVDIIPFYEEEEKIKQNLQNLSPEDKVAIFGHSGSKLGGTSNERWAKLLGQSNVRNCYFGSCDFGSQIEKFDPVKNKNIYYREGKWLGFNPEAESFLEGMFSRAPKYKEDKHYEPAIMPLREGETYQQYKYGGKKQEGGAMANPYAMAGQYGSGILDQLAAGYDEQSATNMGLDTASGAAQGAAAGTMIAPGIGTAIGGLVGGAAGYFKGQQEKEAAKEMEEKRNYLQTVKNFNQKMSGKKSINYQPVFQQGGSKSVPVDQMNQQDGQLINSYEGPKHENGGIDINVAEVEGGETEFDPENYIFSDTLKVPDSNKTFAQESKRIINKYKGDNRFTRNARRRELERLMKQQEEVRSEDRDNEKQEGGFLQGDTTGLDVMSLAAPATTAAMTISDIASDPVEPDLPRMEGEAYTPQLISYRPYAREVERTFGEQEAAITRGARTPGQYMSGRIQSATEEAKAKSDIMNQIQKLNQQERARAEEMGYKQRLQNLQQATREEDMRMKAEAARRNAIRQGLSSFATQLGQISSDVRRTRAQEEYQDKYLDVLSGAYPDVDMSNWSPEISPRGGQARQTQNPNQDRQQFNFMPEANLSQDDFMDSWRNRNQQNSGMFMNAWRNRNRTPIDIENDDMLWNYENFRIE